MTFVSSFFFFTPLSTLAVQIPGQFKTLASLVKFYFKVTSRDLSCDKKNPKQILENIKTSLSFHKQVLNFILGLFCQTFLSFGCPKRSLHHLQVFCSLFNDRRSMLCRLNDKTCKRGRCSKLFILCFQFKMIVLKFSDCPYSESLKH